MSPWRPGTVAPSPATGRVPRLVVVVSADRPTDPLATRGTAPSRDGAVELHDEAPQAENVGGGDARAPEEVAVMLTPARAELGRQVDRRRAGVHPPARLEGKVEI